MKPVLGCLILLCSLCLACAHPVTSTTPVALTRCPIAGVGPVDSSWHQVRASGFTFCVPGAWRPSRPASDSLDPRAWSGKEGSLVWGLGRPDSVGAHARRAAEISVSIVPGGTVGPGTVPSSGRLSARCLEPTTTPYTVDSVVVVVTQTACHGTWMTTAWSSTPAMYVQGEAHSPEQAQLLNAIVVTIRFSSPAR